MNQPQLYELNPEIMVWNTDKKQGEISIQTSKVTKTAKGPVWSKEINMDTFEKQIKS